MRPNTRRHVPNWAMSALNPVGVFRKSSCISDLVANVYDGEWLVVGRSYQVSLGRCQTGTGLIYLFNGAVNSIQITAPSSTSLSAP